MFAFKVLAMQTQRDDALKSLANKTSEFNVYVQLQAQRVRDLELKSSQQAQEAQDKIAFLQKKYSDATASYHSLLKQRNEVPGVLSSAAVDTINAGILENGSENLYPNLSR